MSCNAGLRVPLHLSGDNMELLSARHVFATRKDHVCEGCLETIPKGSEAQYFAWKDMGLQQAYYCIPCDTWIQNNLERDDTYSPGDIGLWRKEEANAQSTTAEAQRYSSGF